MGLFTNLKQGAFLTKCKVTYSGYGLQKSSAESLVDYGAEILLDCYKNNSNPEAALAILCSIVIKNKSEVPMNILGAADRFAQIFIERYPHEGLTRNILSIIKETKE
ncbi:hypothetical protein [Pseudoalteromonas prydzensis]|uniref:hypothetical protein n=1 Tax=Pseudoalteromonas prydzensis TaxID=182141 RepID=UPI003703DA6C